MALKAFVIQRRTRLKLHGARPVILVNPAQCIPPFALAGCNKAWAVKVEVVHGCFNTLSHDKEPSQNNSNG